jgi:lipoate-protein ligase A
MDKWRLIITPAGTGAWNMALDEALLRSVTDGCAPTTLRLYAWQPTALTLGFAQPAADVNFDGLTSEGWDLVRRPTGGSAVLHVDELTYSLTALATDPLLSEGLLESYRKISQALLAGLTRLTVNAVGDRTYGKVGSAKQKNPVCFETTSNYEITSLGKKLIGSAQARKFGGILQHGTLPLYGDITRVTRVLNFSSPEDQAAAAARLTDRATTLENVLGHAPDWTVVANAIVEGFAESFTVSFGTASPTQAEIDLAHTIMTEKYLADTWTFRI